MAKACVVQYPLAVFGPDDQVNTERADTKKATQIEWLQMWLREPDLNRRPSGYEPDELPGCSIPRQWILKLIAKYRSLSDKYLKSMAAIIST